MLGNTSSESDADDRSASPAATDSHLAPASADPPAPAPDIRLDGNKPRRRWLAALLIVSFIASGAYVLTGFIPDTPPEGTIWFGTSFDPDSFEVRGRLTAVGLDDEFVMVGRLTQPLAGSRLVIRGYLDGALITIAWPESRDVGGTWGFNVGPMRMPGAWRYEIAEVGGNALASGQFVVEE